MWILFCTVEFSSLLVVWQIVRPPFSLLYAEQTFRVCLALDGQLKNCSKYYDGSEEGRRRMNINSLREFENFFSTREERTSPCRLDSKQQKDQPSWRRAGMKEKLSFMWNLTRISFIFKKNTEKSINNPWSYHILECIVPHTQHRMYFRERARSISRKEMWEEQSTYDDKWKKVDTSELPVGGGRRRDLRGLTSRAKKEKKEKATWWRIAHKSWQSLQGSS